MNLKLYAPGGSSWAGMGRNSHGTETLMTFELVRANQSTHGATENDGALELLLGYEPFSKQSTVVPSISSPFHSNIAVAI